MRSMVAGALLLLVGCSTSADTPPDSTTTTTIPDGPIRGALPDGTVYDVILDPPAHEAVTGVSAGVVDDGEVKEVVFQRSGGEWTTDGELEVTTHLGLPMVDLPPSLEWAADDRVPMQVTYETFAVRRGCQETAVACNPTQAVQALPLDGWAAREATVVSYALRRPDHPQRVDPGPLPGRTGHDLLWTGEEMIVWGGTGPPRTDGAAYDPDTGAWRLLAPAPLEEGQPTRAVWTGTEMVVVSPEVTAAYHPLTDSWSPVAGGLDAGEAVWDGEMVVAGTEEGIHALVDGTWTELGDPGIDPVLRTTDGRLFAAGPCEEGGIAEWTGGRWVEAAALPEGVCPAPEQVAAVEGRLVVWQDETVRTFVYDLSGNRWRQTDPVPLPSIDRPSGPLPIDGRFLVTRGPEGAIFDPGPESWEQVELPGHGDDSTMVWTGEEVLMWNRCCYEPDDVDAWRWTPPPAKR